MYFEGNTDTSEVTGLN